MPETIQQAVRAPDNDPSLEPEDGEDHRAQGVLDGYLTRGELAAQLNVTKRTVDRWHAMGTGPPRVVIGRTPYYRVDAARQWVVSLERVTLREPRRS